MMTVSDYRKYAPVTPTRFANDDVKIYISKQGVWRFIVEQDGIASTVGEQFKTKFEAFVALPEYAKQWGF